MSKWSANLQLKRSKVKVTRRQKPKLLHILRTCLFTHNYASLIIKLEVNVQ